MEKSLRNRLRNVGELFRNRAKFVGNSQTLVEMLRSRQEDVGSHLEVVGKSFGRL